MKGTETGEVHLAGPVGPGQGCEGAVWHFLLSCLILGQKKKKNHCTTNSEASLEMTWRGPWYGWRVHTILGVRDDVSGF